MEPPCPEKEKEGKLASKAPSSFLIGAIKGKYRRVTGSQGFIVILPFYYADKSRRFQEE